MWNALYEIKNLEISSQHNNAIVNEFSTPFLYNADTKQPSSEHNYLWIFFMADKLLLKNSLVYMWV